MNNSLPKPISNHVGRFIDQYNELIGNEMNHEHLYKLIELKPSQLNNLIMSGLGSSTLLLRLGAVINLSKKLSEKDYDDDALLIKRIIENLKETLPTDTNWKNIWQITCYKESEWSKYVFSKKGEHSLIEKFIIFRNKFVHGFITIQVENSKELFSGLNILHKICTDLSSLFVETQLKEINGKYYFIKNDKKIELYPFVQKGSLDGLPYIFQGIKKNKKSAELINSFFGNIELQDDNEHYEKFFIPMIESLKGGAGKIFDHKRRIDYYNECFVGRDNETSEVLEWANSSNSQNVLPIFSSAGMGKGAFVANLITKLKEEHTPVLYHFCESGLANNLHAILYHLILQGKKLQIWGDNVLIGKKHKIPTKYEDVIILFQNLIENNFVVHKKNTSGNLVIIIDGLDQAYVSYPSYNIGDYFNTYSENGEIIGDCNYKAETKWILTYREGYYKLPSIVNLYELKKVQPLKGLDEDSIINALLKFNPSKEFLNTVIDRGKIL